MSKIFNYPHFLISLFCDIKEKNYLLQTPLIHWEKIAE